MLDAALPCLVLAGRRAAGDPLARSAGVAQRALVPVLGEPMLVRVLRTLAATPAVGRLVVAIDTPPALDAWPDLLARAERGDLAWRGCRDTPSASVVAALEAPELAPPLVVTTADHPLLTTAALEHFVAGARACDADLVAGVVDAACVRAAFPESRRTVIRLRGEGLCGANLYLFRTPLAARVAAFWQRAEQLRKRPWRLAALFGARTLARYALGRLPAEAALARLAAITGARAALLRLPFADCAVDVDSTDDLALATRVLASRGRPGRAGGYSAHSP